MKLWTATAEITVLIASEDEPNRRAIARAARAEAIDNLDQLETYGAQPIESLKEIPPDWLYSIPRGDAEYMTCEQIVNAYLDAKAADAAKRPMPNQISLPLGDQP